MFKTYTKNNYNNKNHIILRLRPQFLISIFNNIIKT